MRLKHLPARSSLSRFNCTLLIGKCLHFLIAFDSDCHTDDFSLFLSWCYWWRVFFAMFFMAFLPSVQIQFFEFICGISRLHVWYFLSCLRKKFRLTLNSGFFPTCFSLWHLLFLYHSFTCTAFGTNITSKKLWGRVKVPFPCFQCIRNFWQPHVVLSTESEKVGVYLEKSFCLSHPCSKYSKHIYCLL